MTSIFVEYGDDCQEIEIDDLEDLKDVFNLSFDVKSLRDKNGKAILIKKKQKVMLKFLFL